MESPETPNSKRYKATVGKTRQPNDRSHTANIGHRVDQLKCCSVDQDISNEGLDTFEL